VGPRRRVAAAFGLGSRFAAVAWVALAICVLLQMLGPLLELPRAVTDLSPFVHSPSLPGGALDAPALLAMTAIAAALVAAGLAAFARRDVSSGT
jgi:ABC-2 type transport system permease protein